MSVARRVDLTGIRNRLVLFLAVLVAWELISLGFPDYLFPGILDTLRATEKVITNPALGSYTGYVIDTFRRLLIGFVIAMVVGSVLGVAMGLGRRAETFLHLWLIFGLALPGLAIAFILILVIGISEWVPILTVALIGTPFVMLNMWEGAQDLDEDIFEMSAFFGASRYQTVREVVLPQLLQYFFPSMYWVFIISWKVLFVAEVFGAGSGVGYMVNYWFEQQRVDFIVGWVIVPGVILVFAQQLLRRAEDWALAWR